MNKMLVLFLAALGLIAEAYCTLSPDDRYFYFCTEGMDSYADGTPLLDGECYGLVWRGESLKETTKGLFDTDGNPVDPANCQILAVFSAAKRGIVSEEPDAGQLYAYAEPSWAYIANGVLGPLVDNGVISLFVFDTRLWNGKNWEVGGKTSETTVATLNSYGLVDSLEELYIDWDIFSYGGRSGPDHSFTNSEDHLSWGDARESDDEPFHHSVASELAVSSSTPPNPNRLVVETLSFRTKGNDCYADNTPVMSGECYALVWKRKGTEFPGLPVDAPEPSDRSALGDDFWIAGYYPSATGDVSWASCSNVTIAAGALPVDEATNGTWTICLLDTRYKTDGGATMCGFDPSVETRPRQINSFTPIAGLTDFTIPLTASPLEVTDLIGGDVAVPTVASQKAYEVFTVTFDSMGGTPTPSSLSLRAGMTCAPLPTDVTLVGWNFDGWFTAATGGAKVTDETIVACDMTLYAHWTFSAVISDFSFSGSEVSLSVTNTAQELEYMISMTNDLAKIHSTTNIVGEAKLGVGAGPLTWTIPVGAEKQGFFKVLPRKPDFGK